jgi:predicted alpha/beta hydrolase family esterase
MKFLIIHGSFGSPQGNWFPALKQKLELQGQSVLSPQFPVDDWQELSSQGIDAQTKKQTLSNWLNAFEVEVLPWIGQEKISVVAHSLAPLFVLHALSQCSFKIDVGIFVSPFLKLERNEKHWQIHSANKTFYEHAFDFGELKQKIEHSYVVYSFDDPYVPVDQAVQFADKLKSSLVPVYGAKHLSSEFPGNDFPLIFELCKTRIPYISAKLML